MSEMSNEAWEVVQRVKMYRKKALEVLNRGGGISDLVQITDELTNTTVVIDTYTFTEGDYYSTLESEFNLVENRFYILTIKDQKPKILK